VYAVLVASAGRVIVIGSGPPGATAALFLSRAGADVLLVEAGTKNADFGLTLRVRGQTLLKRRRPLRQREEFTATGDPKAELFEELAPGGLTNHWSCAVPRFSPEDFADAARAGEAYTWPIGYDDVAPWYDRVEPLLHIAGASHGEEQLPAGRVRHEWHLAPDWATSGALARTMGRYMTAVPYAYGLDTTLTFSGTAFNSFVRLVKPELRARRLDVRYGARAIRLEWSAATRKVDAVIVQDAQRGTTDRIPCRAVVLAAGAIGTTEILLASGNPDSPSGLGDAHGVLGHYLHDHPLGKLVIDLGSSMPIYPPCYLTRPTLERAPPLYAAACMQWGGVEPLARSVLQGRPGRLMEVGFSVFGTMAPTRENWVALEPSKPQRSGLPGLKLHIRHPPESQEALNRARNDVVEILTHAGLKPRVRIWHVEPAGESKHYGGTCRMHSSPRFGMLDAWSRLHAAPNVVVADSAAFTTGPEKNPVLTAMALAARASDRLAEDLKQGHI
jgi:choline dehydrogenase-like flavoprotein